MDDSYLAWRVLTFFKFSMFAIGIGAVTAITIHLAGRTGSQLRVALAVAALSVVIQLPMFGWVLLFSQDRVAFNTQMFVRATWPEVVSDVVVGSAAGSFLLRALSRESAAQHAASTLE